MDRETKREIKHRFCKEISQIFSSKPVVKKVRDFKLLESPNQNTQIIVNRHVNYVKILTKLQGSRNKVLYLVVFSLYLSLF